MVMSVLASDQLDSLNLLAGWRKKSSPSLGAIRLPTGAHSTSKTNMIPCTGLTQSYRLQQMPSDPSYRMTSLHRQLNSSSACFLTIFSEK